MQVWLLFNRLPTFPNDNETGAAGRRKYEEFLKTAEKGIDEKQLRVAAKKAPEEKQLAAKKKALAEKKAKQRRES